MGEIWGHIEQMEALVCYSDSEEETDGGGDAAAGASACSRCRRTCPPTRHATRKSPAVVACCRGRLCFATTSGRCEPRRAGEIEKQGGSVDKKLKLLDLCTVFGGEVPAGLRTFATFPGCKFLFTRSNHAQALIEARYRAGLFAPNFNGWSPSRK